MKQGHAKQCQKKQQQALGNFTLETLIGIETDRYPTLEPGTLQTWKTTIWLAEN